MSALLDVAGLHLAIAAIPILRDVSFTVASGEVLGLVGESGAGKSMVGRAILGVLPPAARITAGGIAFDGHDLATLSAPQRRALLGRGLALIPQDPMTALNPSRRIGAQLCDGLRLHLRLSSKAAEARALDLLGQVQLRAPARVMRHYPHELSGGMRQRVLIAMAFSCAPRLIVADEPTTALDVTVQRQILRLVRQLQRESGTALVFVSHDLGVIAKICDRVAIMHSGRIVESATAAELFTTPRHPYTRALLAATPRYDRPGEALLPIAPALTRTLLDEAAAYDRRAGHG